MTKEFQEFLEMYKAFRDVVQKENTGIAPSDPPLPTEAVEKKVKEKTPASPQAEPTNTEIMAALAGLYAKLAPTPNMQVPQVTIDDVVNKIL